MFSSSTVLLIVAVLLVITGLFIMVVPFFLFPWLARENVLFTKVKEGTVKAIMRGQSFDRFIMSFAEYHLNDPSKAWFDLGKPLWEVVYHGKDRDAEYDDRSWLLKRLGLYWVGWPWESSVYVYEFEWNETYTDKENGHERILPRAEPTDFIFVCDFTYAIVTNGAETKDRLPTDEMTLATVAIRNPYRALFSGEDWMRRITAAINRHVRNFVGSTNYKDLVSTKKGAPDFSSPIIALNEKLPDDIQGKDPHGLHGRYGVVIRTADLQTVDLSGEAKKREQEATTAEYVAKQEAKATIERGKAEARVIELKGKKEAGALEARLAVIKKHGDAGLTLAGLDAMQEAAKSDANNIIWANNPLGGLLGALQSGSKGGEKP